MTKRTLNDNLKLIKDNEAKFFNDCIKKLGNH